MARFSDVEIEPSGIISKVRQYLIAGGAAGNHTLTGIDLERDRLVSVWYFNLAEGAPNTITGVADLTSEFSITADDTINNTGGTATTGGLLIVQYYDDDWGETVTAGI
jgi:hypothetical protein